MNAATLDWGNAIGLLILSSLCSIGKHSELQAGDTFMLSTSFDKQLILF